MLPARHVNARLPGILWWRIERRLKDRELAGRSPVITDVIVDLIEQGLGDLTVEEKREIARMRLDAETPRVVHHEDSGPPTTCPGCGESEMPLVGGPIFRVSSADRTVACNNCGYEGRY